MLEEAANMNVLFADLGAQHKELETPIREAIARVIETNSFILGPDLDEFERNFAQYCDAPYAVGVDNGLSALEMALIAHGVQPGDEVITVSHTFVATVAAVCNVGAKPVFVEVNPTTHCMDPDAAEAAISSKTKAILPVHLYGHPADLERLHALSIKSKVPLIEDAAQAHGARFHGRRVGPWADTACYSFYPGKNLGALGDGGMVVTRHREVAEKIKRIRNYGQERKYLHVDMPSNRRLDTIQAAVLNVKLGRLDAWNSRRREIAARYHERLGGLRGLTVPSVPADYEHVFHLYVVEHPERDEFAKLLSARGISTGFHYPLPCHLQPCFESLGLTKGSLPITERLASTVLSLPMYPHMSDEQADHVCEAVREVLSSSELLLA